MVKKSEKSVVLLIALFVSCASLSDNNEPSVALPHPGMKKISSNGLSFSQGWNDPVASPEEKPGINTIFTYDYWIDSTEITQKQYYDITGKHPVPDSGPYGVGDQYPVCFVTWFDAVLFCNARSKADGLDTVYKYSIKYSAPDGRIYELGDVTCDFSKEGYRLPTEAEWEFAARGASSTLQFCSASELRAAQNVAWFGANSSGTTRPVATKSPNSLGLYDVAGNVFEWTNDWKGPYTGSAVINPLGSSQSNLNREKVIKGGSFNYGLEYLRPSYRSAPFLASLSSADEFIGFRCVRGPIETGTGHYITIPDTIHIDFALDSLGLYDDPASGQTQNDFGAKMHLFWEMHNQLEMIFLGDPTLYCGIDCGMFRPSKALNMGVSAGGISYMSMMIDNYLLAHAPKLRLVGVNVPFYFEPLIAETAESSMGLNKGYRYDKSHDFWRHGVPSGFDDAMAKQPFPLLENYAWDSLGLRHWGCAGWGDTIPEQMWAKNWTVIDSTYRAQFASLVKVIEKLSAHNVHLLMIDFPESPYYRNTPYYTRFGPDRETGKAVIVQLKALESIYPYFHFYDANLDGNHDYTDAEATSFDRLCPEGAKKLTGRINIIVDSILSR
jgi:formylglycine-generating enzyme required for sulfatase activity